LDLTALQNQALRSLETAPASLERRHLESGGRARTASELILAAELQARGEATDALSMMVSSIARMVQAGKSSDSRWKAS
jgi:hypothetical protein